MKLIFNILVASFRLQNFALAKLRWAGISTSFRRAFWKARLKALGDKVNIHPRVAVHQPSKVSVGHRSSIAEFVHIWGGGGVDIGNDVLVASHVVITSVSHDPDVVIVGTDPVFAAVTAIPIRIFARDIRLVHWCFDMHPEAAVAAKLVSANSLETHLMRKAYHSFDLIADIGTCMRERLREYGHNAIECELTPWALVEPKSHCTAIDQSTRYKLFAHSQIGLLYSGNFGEAHEFSEFLALARALRQNENIHFCFAIRGNQAEAFRNAVTTDDINISFAPFAKIEDLEKRLNSADIHLVSLKENWAGLAVPSTFFGSLASAKPILYSGSKKSAIGTWITQHKLGRTIDPNNISETVDWIEDLAKEPSKLSKLQRHCHSLYQAQLMIRYESLWEKQSELEAFLGFRVALPPKRARSSIDTTDPVIHAKLKRTFGDLDRWVNSLPDCQVLR